MSMVILIMTEYMCNQINSQFYNLSKMPYQMMKKKKTIMKHILKLIQMMTPDPNLMLTNTTSKNWKKRLLMLM